MPNDYKTVGSSADVENINPNTQNSYNALAQLLGSGQAGMGQVIADLRSLDYDPEAWFSQWQSQMPYMQQLAGEAVAPYNEAGISYAQQASNQARRNIEQQYGGGGLYSGAFGKAVGEGMASPYLQAAANSEQLQANLFQGLASPAMGYSAQGQQFNTQADLQALAEQGNLFGAQMTAGAAGMTQLGMPEYWQPTYVEDVPVWQQMLGGGVSGALAGLASGNPLGALLGGLGGAASGALGMSGAGAGAAASGYFDSRQRQSNVDAWTNMLQNFQTPQGSVPNVPTMPMYQATLGNLGYQYPMGQSSYYPPTPITMDNSLMSLYQNYGSVTPDPFSSSYFSTGGYNRYY